MVIRVNHHWRNNVKCYQIFSTTIDWHLDASDEKGNDLLACMRVCRCLLHYVKMRHTPSLPEGNNFSKVELHPMRFMDIQILTGKKNLFYLCADSIHILLIVCCQGKYLTMYQLIVCSNVIIAWSSENDKWWYHNIFFIHNLLCKGIVCFTFKW